MPAPAPGVPIERLLELVSKGAAEYFPGEPAGDVRLVAANRRSYAEIYRVAIGGSGQPGHVILKVFRGASAQFAAMRRVWPHFGMHPRFGIPEPLDLLAEGPTLVMKSVGGTPINNRLPRIWWFGRGPRTAENECRGAGQWLRFYHELESIAPPAAIDVHDQVKGLESSLRELRSAGFDHKLCDRIMARALSSSDRLDGRKLCISRLHGDFTIDNVLIDAPRVVALDLWGEHIGAVANDISSFLNSLLLIRLTRPAPWLTVKRLQAAFLDGYTGDRPVDRFAIAFLQTIGLADVILEIVARRRSAASRRWIAIFVASVLSGPRFLDSAGA